MDKDNRSEILIMKEKKADEATRNKRLESYRKALGDHFATREESDKNA